ncbi:phytase [bacterium]|nr:phytase [bacterium]
MRVVLAGVALLIAGAGCTHRGITVVEVVPSIETDPMTGVGDRADDPALWVNRLRPEHSRILGSNKEEGLHVYDLAGRETQMLPVGRLNNVDVRGDLAVGSNDAVNGLSWFRIDPGSATVTHAGDTPVVRVEPYGVCAGMIDGGYVAGVTYKDGTVELWSVSDVGAGAPTAVLSRTLKLGSQVEGCVFDDAARRLFVGEEAVGVWAFNLADPEGPPVGVDTVSSGRGLAADVEGVSLWLGADGGGFLVVSAQEKDRFVVYDRSPPYAVRGVIRVGAGDGVDRVTHTDGLDASSAALPGYPAGVLVVQDDGNPRSGVDQNFKLVDWREVERALGLAP